MNNKKHIRELSKNGVTFIKNAISPETATSIKTYLVNIHIGQACRKNIKSIAMANTTIIVEETATPNSK